MPKPILVIVLGRPCTGKTTLGRRIARGLGWPFVHKDGIKELLFDNLGWSDREWSKKLGRASSELLYYLAETHLSVGRSLVVESNFVPQFATPKLLALKEKLGFEPFQILCQAPAYILFERFKVRAESGERHPGHVDHLNYDEFRATLHNSRSKILDIGGKVVEIDTTDFQTIDDSGLLKAIQSAANNL